MQRADVRICLERRGIVDHSFLCDFLPVAAIFVRLHSLRSGLRIPPRLGRGSFPGATSARPSSASPRRSGDLSFLLAEHAGGYPSGFLHSEPPFGVIGKDPAYHPVARISGFSAGSL